MSRFSKLDACLELPDLLQDRSIVTVEARPVEAHRVTPIEC